MTDFAKDVAKQLDRRQRRRKLIVYGVWLLVVVLAAIYLRCGRGWGLGGKGGDGGGVSGGGNPRRCAIRVTASGITLDGKPAARAAVIAACTTGADVVVTGDARQGDWDDLREALHAANIDVVVHDAHH